MCVKAIIDASAFRHLLEPTQKTAGDLFRNWILAGNGFIVNTSEAQYDSELENYSKVLPLLKDYRQRGLVEYIDAEQVQLHMEHIPDRPIRRSNDSHILALAAASKATVLFSCDYRLQRDFADTNILTNVGRTRRRSVPLRIKQPEDTNDVSNRRQFFNRRKCKTPQ